jgi:HEAT repeat protein
MSAFNDPDGEAEQRYRALLALEPGEQTAPRLIDALHDENWRVRKLAAELLARSDPTPELVDRLIEVLGEKGRTGARNAAAAALGQLGSAAVPGLLALLTRPDPDQRKFAAEILGDLSRQEAVRGLIDAIDDTDANVRAAAAEALGRVGSVEAGRALEGLLTRSREPLLRVAALEGLITLKRPPPLPALVPLLDDPALRRSAFRLLGHVPHPAAVGLLLRGLLSPWREAALAGLGVRGEALGPSVEEEEDLLRRMGDARAFLQAALASDDLDVRSGALQLAPSLHDASLAPAIAAACEGPLAERALRSLLLLGLPGARALLEGEVPEVLTLPREARGLAAEALLRMSDPALVGPATALLHSGDVEGVELGLRLLGRSRSERAVPALEAALAEEATAAGAARALVTLGQSFPAEVTAALERFLQRGARPHALRALARVAPQRAEPVLKAAYRSEDAAVRAAAVGEAGQLRESGQSIIATALMDESAPVRQAAAHALASLGPAQAGPLLERALDDLEPTVLAAAADACARCGATACAPRLVGLLGASNAQVALAALEALDRLGALDDAGLATAATHADPEVLKAALDKGAWRPSGIARAQALLSHPSWDVRAAAGRALATSGDRGALLSLQQALERETDALAREVLLAAAAALAGR